MIEAVELFSSACLKLTAGQHLDIDFENRENVTTDQYFNMISGKTAALLSCCTQMGALIAGFDKESQFQFSKFGNDLGMAFQIYDDWLGIWGDPEVTGKSASSDIIERKKSLPVILGLKKSNRFLTRWKGKPISQDEVGQLSEWLREDGIEEFVMKEYNFWNQNALDSLDALRCDENIKSALNELAIKLLMRTK